MEITIKTLRIRQGLEQKDVERALGVASGSVSHWENDGVLPKLKYIQQLARLYKVSTDALIEVLGCNNFKQLTEGEKVVVIDHTQYTILPDDEPYLGNLGHGGSVFYIRMLDTGIEYVTHNLWCQGDTAEADTAEFFEGECRFI